MFFIYPLAPSRPWHLSQTSLFTCILYPMLFYKSAAISFFYYFCIVLLYLMLYVALGSVGPSLLRLDAA